MADPSAQILSPASGLSAAHNYIPNQGYQSSTPNPLHSPVRVAHSLDEAEETSDLAHSDDDDSIGNFDGDYRYNTQPAKAQDPSNNDNLRRKGAPQKPKMNSKIELDDKISSLSKHASKISLEKIGGDKQNREKDKSDRATKQQVMDNRTVNVIASLINNGSLKELGGVISTGKEANVYGSISIPNKEDWAKASQQTRNDHIKMCATKVYKTSILVFKDRERYVAGEHRFQGGINKGSNRAMVKVWAEKEFRNLKRLYQAGIRCPEPMYLRQNVLVMGWLGLGYRSGGAHYPKLRDVEIEDDDIWLYLYLQLIGTMRRMYQVCKLIHGDLSEYNILYHEKQLYIIDVSQSVEHDHPRAVEFLRMDIKNITDFFRRRSVDVMTERSLYDVIISPNGPLKEDEDLINHLRDWFDNRKENTEAEQRIDNEVFRQQYIPRYLDQVPNPEEDAKKIGEGKTSDLVYHNLLADTSNSLDSESVESDGGADLKEETDSDDESKFEKGTPRGKRFEDKELKKEHKKAVKEEKREKRKEKMPKSVKKKLVSTTAKHKH